MTDVKRNAVRCLKCGDTIESVRKYDSARCSCGHVAVDGGLFYRRRSWFGKKPRWVELLDHDGTESPPLHLNGPVG